MKRHRFIQAAAAVLLTVILTVTSSPVYIAEQNPGKDRQTGEAQSEERQISSVRENEDGGAGPGGAAGKRSEEGVEAGGSAEKADRPMRAVILGDSIAKGYSADKETEITPYGDLAAEKIAGDQGREWQVDNFAKNGLDSERMNTEILAREEVLGSVREADVIFITVGSNDLLNECKNTVREILNTDTKFKSAGEALKVLEEALSENPFLIVNIIGALNGWDYQSFDTQWTEIIETVCAEKKEAAEIVVTNIYNPVANMKLPSTMNGTVEDIIGNMNTIIEGYAGEYGYAVADVFDSELSEHVQDDGLHPDQTGQQMIAALVCEAYENMRE